MRAKRMAGVLATLGLMMTSPPALAADRPPQRPNVLLIVADDLGFSDLGAFGGEIHTPNLDALARHGVRFTNFHTAPTCSPSRAMLLTGIDNHEVGLGTMAEQIGPAQRGKPGYEGYLNDRIETVAERLQASGYTTLMTGKWHLGLEETQSPAARGFDKSMALLQALQNHYGANQGEAWRAAHQESTFRENGQLTVYPKGRFSADYYTDRMLEFLKAAPREKPFFAYMAFTEPHFPLQAPLEDIAKYKGVYDDGPEALRDRRVAQLKALGLVPKNVVAHELVDVPAWSSLSPEDKARQTRVMEVYAAMVDRLDQNVGRLIKALKASGQYDNTMIIFMSDNGPEGGHTEGPGSFGGEAAKALKINDSLDNVGAADSWAAYGPGWAQASSAPSWMYKQYVTEGGVRNVAFVSGPHVTPGRVTDAFLHITDVTPTVLELAKTPASTTFHGHAVLPVEGRSMLPVLEGKTPAIHGADELIGSELFFERSMRQGDWKAIWLSRDANGQIARRPGPDAAWELYNLRQDPGERINLAPQEPERLKRLATAWTDYATRVGVVLPGKAAAPAVRHGPPIPAAGPLSVEKTPVSVLMANPAAREILIKALPPVERLLGRIKDMSLVEVSANAPQLLDDAKLRAIQVELDALK